MCGIAGILNFTGEPVSSIDLKKMTDAIAHRGPDGEGFYIDKGLGFGHRRLAIIDLTELGKQPMSTKSREFIITYNGELYNFQDLRVELEAAGHTFISRSDTEVVLYAYKEWGQKCLSRFNGMFAFAIWDAVNRELFIARDRYGIKPLYYSYTGKSFMFASEQKAILTLPEFRKSVDKDALIEYFTFQNIFTDRTLLKEIKLFPAGSWAKISQASNTLRLNPKQYWNYYFSEPIDALREEEYIEELDRLFEQAVKRQLISDVEIGSYLSGGIDSGSITAISAKKLPCIKTFTVGFDLHSASGLELSFDEREKAEYMSYLFQTEHYEMVLKAGDMERVIQKLSWHLEEPRMGQSYPNYYAAQLASKFVKVCLSGSGGDELFGGYPWRYYRAIGNNDSFEDYIGKYYSYWQRLVPDNIMPDLFKPIWAEISDVSTKDIFRNIFHKHDHNLTDPQDYINHSLYLEAKTFLHGLLIVEDKLSMAHSLETRLPFLDNELVDFAMKLPMKFKLRNLGETIRINENQPGSKKKLYYLRTNDGKMILRNVMGRYIPESIISADKQGFSAPDASWFKGESIDYIKKQLSNKKAYLYDYMNYDTVQKYVGEHFAGRENRRLFIWSLLSLEWWLKNYMK